MDQEHFKVIPNDVLEESLKAAFIHYRGKWQKRFEDKEVPLGTARRRCRKQGVSEQSAMHAQYDSPIAEQESGIASGSKGRYTRMPGPRLALVLPLAVPVY